MTEFILNNLGMIISIATIISCFYVLNVVKKHFTYCEKMIEKIAQFVYQQTNSQETEIIKKINSLDERKRERLLERLETLCEEQNETHKN